MAGSNRLPGTQEAEKLSRVLGDIGNKLERVHSLSTFRFEMDFEKLDDVNKALWNQYGNFQKLNKVWPEYAQNLRRLNIAQNDAAVKLKKFVDEYQRLDEKKNKKGLTADELQRWDELCNDILPKAKSRVAALNDSINVTDAKVKAVATSMAKWGESLVTKLAKGSLGLVGVAFETFIQTLNSGWEMQNRFRASFAGMAKQIGAFTPQLRGLQDFGQSMYFANDSLGAMGMSMDDIGSQVSGFASALGIMDEGMLGNTKNLVEWGTALGLSGDEVGQFSRSMMFLGKNGNQVQDMFQQVATDAKRLGVSSAVLSKNVFQLGKNLLAMSGPKFQDQMRQTIEKFTKIGLSVQTLESFTEMTDNFDKTADSMARMNTAFGTHVNAMDVFLEQDPAKRFQKITDQLRLQGISLQTIGRNEMRMLSQTTGMQMDEVNAMLKWSAAGDDVGEMLKKRGDDLASFNEGMVELKSVLVATGRMFDKIMLTVFKSMAPVFNVLGLSFDKLGSGMQGITMIADKFESKLTDALGSLSSNEKAQAAFRQLGESITVLGKKFMDFISSEKFPEFLASLTKAVSGVAQIATTMVSFFSNDLVLGGLKFMAEHFGKILVTVLALKGAMFAMQAINLGRTLSGVAGAAGAGAGAGGGFAGMAGGAAAMAGTAGKAILGKGIGGAAGGLVGGLAGAGISSAMGIDNGIGGAIGGLIGGGIGLLAPFPGGALIGSTLGTIAGNWIESKMAKSGAQATAASGPSVASSPIESGSGEASSSATTQAVTAAARNDVLEPLNINVQVLLDGNVIQEHVMKQELRRHV